jgi:hypothetical protein
MLNFDSVLDAALKNAEDLKAITDSKNSTFVPKTKSTIIS